MTDAIIKARQEYADALNDLTRKCYHGGADRKVFDMYEVRHRVDAAVCTLMVEMVTQELTAIDASWGIKETSKLTKDIQALLRSEYDIGH